MSSYLQIIGIHIRLQHSVSTATIVLITSRWYSHITLTLMVYIRLIFVATIDHELCRFMVHCMILMVGDRIDWTLMHGYNYFSYMLLSCKFHEFSVFFAVSIPSHFNKVRSPLLETLNIEHHPALKGDCGLFLLAHHPIIPVHILIANNYGNALVLNKHTKSNQ